MTENQVASQPEVKENKPSDKELNFRKVEARSRELEQRLEQEKQARIELERQLNEKQSSKVEEDEDDDEPYVAPKKLDKKLAKFGKNTHTEIQKAMEIAKQSAKEELKQELWLENNSDFNDVLTEENLIKLVNKAPGMTDSIKKMPDGFDKQKLVYNAIKSLGLDKPEPKQSSIQDTVNANKRSPYYQPSGIGTAPYAAAGDFSPSGQKNAYSKMKELQNRLRG